MRKLFFFGFRQSPWTFVCAKRSHSTISQRKNIFTFFLLCCPFPFDFFRFYVRFNFNLIWHIIIVIAITITTKIIITMKAMGNWEENKKMRPCHSEFLFFSLNILTPLACDRIWDSNIRVEVVTTSSNTWSWLCLLALGDLQKRIEKNRRQVKTWCTKKKIGNHS